MNTGLTVVVGVFALGVSLQAATSYTFDFNTTSGSGLTTDGSTTISPYTGTVSGLTVKLYCDDFNDEINYGQQNISAYVTALNASSTTLDDDTRYGDKDANSTYPAGTQLYDEMAWLSTQMMAQSNNSAGIANDKAIQEAIWTLTDDSADTNASPHNETYTASGTLSDSAQQSYSQWLTDAQNEYKGTLANSSGYASLVVGDWYVVTAVSSAGCTVGSATGGCTPGTAGTGNTTQEFLAYYSGNNMPVSTQTASATPEPASVFLFGSGLLSAGLVARRRTKKRQ